MAAVRSDLAEHKLIGRPSATFNGSAFQRFSFVPGGNLPPAFRATEIRWYRAGIRRPSPFKSQVLWPDLEHATRCRNKIDPLAIRRKYSRRPRKRIPLFE
ncbi:hypothetical protein SCP_0607930 [Sparassis crispa]|uniref:Uncharacterized protein n=1 Tax=Sparassis crispa TaxID=139825 RepID=A0A401GRH6_9APHY|nr:hypothetical protein SCP_0607930 [Sparassis crispa]GBE84813.1 hypothetical protein SCP_0607930 [Sparassis crispa]